MRGFRYNNFMGAALGGASIPAWVLAGAVVDMDFANGAYFGGTLANLLSVVRASSKTNLLPSSVSGFAYSTFPNNVLAITPGSGALIEEARTNVLANPTAPATQTTASLAVGTYTLWVNGSGSAMPSAGTATITGASAATNGAPDVFAVTVAGTVNITVSGSLNAFQCELGAFGTSLILSGTRAADNVTAAGALASVLSNTVINAPHSIVTQTLPLPVGTAFASSPLTTLIYGGAVGNIPIAARMVTTYRTVGAGGAIIDATIGGAGSWTTTSPLKGGIAGDAVSRSAVANNGTVSGASNLFSGGGTFSIGSQAGTAGTAINSYFQRLTAWNTRLPDATLKAFTQ